MARLRRPSDELLSKAKANANDSGAPAGAKKPKPSSPKKKATPKMMDPAALKKAFDAFDVDGSGFIDTQEMTRIVKKLKLGLSAQQIKQLMADADPNGSGSVDYAEFEAVLRKQLEAPGGSASLAGVVGEASTGFGWLNPLGWGSDTTEKPPAPSPTRQARPPSASKPVKPRTPGRSGRPATAPPSSVPSSPDRSKRVGASTRSAATTATTLPTTTTQSLRSPIPRMKRTQYAIGEANHMAAAAMREEAASHKAWADAAKQRFLRGQHEKVLKGHLAIMQRVEAQEAMALTKVQKGLQMREQIARRAQDAQRKQREFVERNHSAVFDARAKKRNEVQARVQAEREEATSIAEAAKAARAVRREQAKATIKKQERAAQEFTAKVRYETRAEVRQEGLDMFEARRRAVAEEARLRAEREAKDIQAQRQAYLASAAQQRVRIAQEHAKSHQSREALVEKRRHEAERVRVRIAEAREQKAYEEEMRRQGTHAMHDEVLMWKAESVIPAAEAEKSTWGWWV